MSLDAVLQAVRAQMALNAVARARITLGETPVEIAADLDPYAKLTKAEVHDRGGWGAMLKERPIVQTVREEMALACETGSVRFPGTGQVVSVEIARSPHDQATGLSNRPYMPHTRGMLFDFGKDVRRSMTTREMNFPIDIIFIAASGVVLSIHSNVQPQEETIDGSGRFVLELNGGWARQHDVRAGDHVELHARTV